MRAILLAAAFVLAGCATAPAPHAINLPAASAHPASEDISLEGDVMVLAFSGGGARAAAFSLGALEGLRDLRAADGRAMLDHVRIVSGVSGGAILAAYFGQHGAAGVARGKNGKGRQGRRRARSDTDRAREQRDPAFPSDH